MTNSSVDSYVIHIYRREPMLFKQARDGQPEHKRLVGVVELIGSKHRTGFQNMEQLWRLLEKEEVQDE